ncbi:MAG: DUF3791 domain-containing protein [Treponema sp.]|nr:DUF3791 domain-containing protein [Treponema sp.]
MTDEMRFFIFLIETYAYDKQLPTAEVLKTWEEKELVQKIYDMYEMYHIEAIENAYADIDNLVKTGKHLW